ncbi:MAG: ATP-binding protein [Defluviitaleaceae bacterium]|nr:ATP-binding protein [Defluviitaleaceae bacterium]
MSEAINFEAENIELKAEINRLNIENRKLSREIRVQKNFMDRTRKSADAKEALSTALSLENSRHKAHTDMLLESCPSIIMLFDSSGMLVLTTNQFFRETGIPNFGFVKNHTYTDVLSKFLSKSTMEKFTQNIEMVVQDNGIAAFDAWIDFKGTGDFEFYGIELQRTDGTTRVAGIEGVSAGTLVIMNNLNEFMMEKFRADASNRAKSDFLAVMSHEIRTPLNAILGLSQIEIQSGDLSDRTTESLYKINSSGNHLLGIVNDILDLSKIETGKLELLPNNYDVPSLINDAIQLNLVRIGSKPIKFELEVDENLPSILYGDELRLKQVLNNLLSNAIKYTDEGIVKLTVSHKNMGEQILLRFCVSDTGQGIRPEDLERLFHEYVRLNTDVNRITEGAGLGLNITKKLVDMMDGKIDVDSTWGEGTSFTATLMQDAVECTPIGTEVVESLMRFDYLNSGQFDGLKFKHELMPYGRVLVVDDVEVNLFVARGLLAPYGMHVQTALSGFDAIEKVESGEVYDIIFMDFMMPVMDGVETTQKLRKMGYDKPIIALTANVLAGSQEMYADNGFDGTVAKPIDAMFLNSVLVKHIRNKYPEEAEKYKGVEIATKADFGLDSRLLQIFCRDAEKALPVLLQTLENGDLKLFTITVHAMKSALANVGEAEASGLAATLEDAARIGLLDIVKENAPEFIAILGDIVKKFKPADDESTTNSTKNIEQDNRLLIESLQKIIAFCDEYDDGQAFVELDEISTKPLDAITKSTIDEIHQTLYLHSDFEKAAEICIKLINSL